MDTLVSVVVPVYNVEKYICDCIDSIIRQTYTDLEIILSDDGSTDGCGRICDKYAEKDDRVKVIHAGNMGLSEARNRGIRIASGDYITFVDSDDVLDRSFVQKLMHVMQEYHTDISVAAYRTFLDTAELAADGSNGETGDKEVLSEKCLYDVEFLKKETTCLTVAWGKLYKKQLFHDIWYPVGKLHEDTFTTYKLMDRADKVVYLKEKLYYWRENPDSISRGPFQIKHLDEADAYMEQMEFFHAKGLQRYVEIVFGEYLEAFFWCFNRMRECDMDLEPLKPYLVHMRNYLCWIKPTKSMGIYQWIRYRYLVWYKIPKLLG